MMGRSEGRTVMRPTIRPRVVAVMALMVAILSLTASAAYAWIDVTGMVLSEYPISRGAVLITVGVNCVDHETFAPTTADAAVTVTLSQGRAASRRP
jgi:hypothetical protein